MPVGRIGDLIVIVEHIEESEQRSLLEVLVRVLASVHFNSPAIWHVATVQRSFANRHALQ
jgi:hypothetical protein